VAAESVDVAYGAARLRSLTSPLWLVVARARRRPGRWALPWLGIALAAAFAVAVAAEGTIAGDQSARSVLSAISPLDRTVRVSWSAPVAPPLSERARALLGRLRLGPPTEALLLNPVRLSGVVVRPAAIAPLGRWLPGAPPGRCRAGACPMLDVGGGGALPRTLSALGVHITVAGSEPLSSAVPLGFTPAGDADQPVLLTGDLAGLEALAGLSGVYRSHSWFFTLPVAALHSWQLQSTEARLGALQSTLQAQDGGFSLSAPFAGLEAARVEAGAGPRRLLLTGGGALAALVLFVLLAGASLRCEQLAELERLRYAGARSGQLAVFVAAEAGWLCAAALITGAGVGLAAAAALAHAAGEPTGGVLTHSLITPTAAFGLAGGWIVATTLFSLSVLVRSPRAADTLAVAAVSVLGLGLILAPRGDHPPAVLLAPLCCLAAGVIVYRLAAVLLVSAERLARRGPLATRLALVGLARAPGLPALAIAFITISVGLGGFALAYRSTLLRGASDQAADRVPLDALVAPGQNFQTPLELAPLRRWSSLARGRVFPVRRTEAGYVIGAGTVTVPALGVPAAALALMHGWRTADGPAPPPALARRLRPPGPVRNPGPMLPADARRLTLLVASPALAVSVTADLRDPQGGLRQLPLGAAGGGPTRLQARVPPGRWELEALELDEPTGREITDAHQNGENPAAATQSAAPLSLGPVLVAPGSGQRAVPLSLGGWRAVGAASADGAAAGAVSAGHALPGQAVGVRFAASGLPGLVRPAQPSDRRPVPILADPQTAAAAAPDRRLNLTVDGLPVSARVVGTLGRFPTLAVGAAGFVVADEATLASALDAQLPGQGRPDELWVASRNPAPLRAALRSSPLSRLEASFRADLVKGLRSAPVARGVLGTLVAASALTAVLAILGLLATLLGDARDRRTERDLEAQGVGPRALRAQARVRLMLAGVAGVVLGLGLALLLTRLAVITVRAAGAVSAPRPPLVSVTPWPALGLWGLGLIVVLATATWTATRRLIDPGRPNRRRRPPAPITVGQEVTR
jgi:hypothetical protein